MNTPQDTTEHAFGLLARLARESTPLSAELEGSLAEFFGGSLPAGDTLATLHNARRHLEWYLLERHSPALLGVPAERLLSSWRKAAVEDGLGEEAITTVQDSFTGAYEVTGLAEDGAWLRDLAGLGDYPLERAPAGLAVGDLLVGRLYPAGDGPHAASPGIGVFRGPELKAALERDLGRVREAGGKVLRLSQLELERLFFQAVARPAEEARDPVAEARAVLLEGGLTQAQVDEVLASLSSSPFDGERLVLGAGDALGELLDRLAFDTSVDLQRARSVLAEAWPVLAGSRGGRSSAAAAPAVPAETPESQQRAALASFDAGRAAGRDLDELFGELERDLQVHGESEPDPGEVSPAPDFPGVVGAMLEEFRWEVEQEEGAEAAGRHAALAPLGEYASQLGRFEELDRAELLRFATFWLPEKGALDGAGTRRLLESLEAFCAWAEEAHQMPLASEFASTLAGLRVSLPRIADLNLALPEPPAGATGVLYEVCTDERGILDGLIDREGQHHRARLGQGLPEGLLAGDRLRGELDLEGRLSIFRCYPPEAAGLSA